MKTRLIFGALAIAYLVLMFVWGGWFFNLSILVFAGLAQKEFYAAFRSIGYNPAAPVGYGFTLLLFYARSYVQPGAVVYFFALAALCMLTLPVLLPKVRPQDGLITLGGLLYPAFLLTFAITMRTLPAPYRESLLILTIAVTVSTDTFAYFTGSALGRHKLCPAISPNKTVEGSLGGLAGGLLVSVLLSSLLPRWYPLQIHWIHFAAIGLLAAIFAQFGDLAASVIKRTCGIKDFGLVLPGHGGMLDRLDSLLFTVPLIYGYYLFFL